MPILEVEVVLSEGETLAPGLARRLADAAAGVFGLPTGRTWVRLRPLPADSYAENGVAASDTPRPVFVEVLKNKLPDNEAMAREAVALASAIAKVCGRPRESIHILYPPPAAGRIAFGGILAGE